MRDLLSDELWMWIGKDAPGSPWPDDDKDKEGTALVGG